ERFGRAQRTAAREDRKPREQLLLVGGEEVMRPLDRRAKRVLARFRIAAAFQEIETLGEPVQDLLRGEHTGAGRGELDGEREVVKAATKLGGRLVRLEPTPLTEERHGLGLGERRHGVLDLAPPGPLSVTNRCPRTSSATSAVSRSRPTNEDAGRGRFVLEIVLRGGKRSSPSWKIATGSAKSFSRCSPRSVTPPSRNSRVAADNSTCPP